MGNKCRKRHHLIIFTLSKISNLKDSMKLPTINSNKNKNQLMQFFQQIIHLGSSQENCLAGNHKLKSYTMSFNIITVHFGVNIKIFNYLGAKFVTLP